MWFPWKKKVIPWEVSMFGKYIKIILRKPRYDWDEVAELVRKVCQVQADCVWKKLSSNCPYDVPCQKDGLDVWMIKGDKI